jgi:uncharacterized protein YdaU (DUF1376 family)
MTRCLESPEERMNFYDFHIGDYTSRTGHLEPMEDLAYRRLLDLYYMREAPLPADVNEVSKLIRLRSFSDIVKAVLDEFFQLTDHGWEHLKCEEVIAAAKVKRTKAKASANARWHSDGDANALRPHCEGNAPSPSPSPINTPLPPRRRGASKLSTEQPRHVESAEETRRQQELREQGTRMGIPEALRPVIEQITGKKRSA